MEYLDIPKRNITSWTLINFFFVCLSIAEMMIEVMMKVMSSLKVCTNMKSIHILKSYIDAILVSDISSMHAYPQQHPCNIKQTQIHMTPHPIVYIQMTLIMTMGLRNQLKHSPLLKLIGGTLVGGVKYSDLYIDPDEDKYLSSTNSYVTNNDKGHDKNNTLHKIPTLLKIAQKVAKIVETQLDEKQYISYEMIACSFLLGLVNDGRDKNRKMGAYLQQTMEITSTTDANDIIKQLKARGGRDQLLMFLTGPAGSGRSTAMKVAQQFCYEFCIAVGIMWSDKTFIFTIYIGLTASLFGGVTISNAAFLNQRKQLSVDKKNEWQDVQIVVIDEVSFVSDTILKTLDKKLNEIEN
jgi:hypothetical protein